MSVSLEERVAILESEILLIKKKVEISTTKPWWEKNLGKFANSSDYDKAMQLGIKYRLHS
ncbi:hypothetical protein Syn7502_03626 (plasmid) [Synechococcus sp. PCC 7502]|uniref:hypothetical protein n=1 Tax=Synechococcus sp. PCC 7502 TaxID=1173263 RepID=UPI00029FAFDA|nr:hypothetical protein [Synechococcus sp. PCC 7502]AFY75453.1 hypothetical protein Syn7502_03626 [Synechococcus sp. PCC 7502]